MALNLVILGPPGGGKDTQADRLVRTRGIEKISTGDVLREAVHAETEVGRRAHSIMDRGELVSDDVMIEIVRERLQRPDVAGGFVLDGFPRTVAQASALDAIMRGRAPLIVIDILVPEPELLRRLSSRLICDDPLCGGHLVRRADDNADVVRERLKVYHVQTRPLLDYYRARPTFRSVNGAQPPDRVAADISAVIEEIALITCRSAAKEGV